MVVTVRVESRMTGGLTGQLEIQVRQGAVIIENMQY